ncbi:MAG: histidine kinase [Thiolinea sp.]
MGSTVVDSPKPEPAFEPSNSARPVGLRAQSLNKPPSTKPVIAFPLRARIALTVLLTWFIGIGSLYFWVVHTNAQSPWIPPVMTVLWVIAGAGVLTLLYWMWSEFVLFGTHLSAWAQELRKGNLTVRMPTTRRGCPSIRIREQINAITDDYQAVSRMQQQRLNRQEQFIAQKNHHLSVLYEVAASVNRSNTLDDLLKGFLTTLQAVFKAEAVAVRLLDSEGKMKLVGYVGLDAHIASLESKLPHPDCLCGRAASEQAIIAREDMRQCGLILGRPMFKQERKIEMLAIPLSYREKALGMYNLFVSRDQFVRLEEEHELLTSIGQHLGMAIEKASVEEDARLLSIMEERTRMAHELHDSLAQTLASLRFKIRLFDDSLKTGNESVIWQEVKGLEQNIDEAYAELRSLITHFRAPIDGKGVVRAVEKLTERFKLETKFDVFFYHNWNLQDLDRDVEVEVIRIVQEALTNVRKHSKASTVRILMYSSEEGRCSILVEDDGVGLPEPLLEPNPTTGEHIGMQIMQERAGKIGGEIQFESDPDEGGTLMQLSFDAPPVRQLSELVGRQANAN